MKFLLTNSGRRSYMVDYLRQIRDQVDFPLEIAVSDNSFDKPTMMMGSDVEKYQTQRVDKNPSFYAEELLKTCVNNYVDVVIPLMDFELPALAKTRARFAEAGVSVVVSDEETILNTLNKQRFYKRMMLAGLPVPRVVYALKSLEDFPVPAVQKPVYGSGSLGLKKIDHRRDLPIRVPPGNVVQEFVSGTEFGMDVFNDMEGGFVHATLKRKIAMRCGETDAAEVLPVNPYESHARHLSAVFQHRGNLDVDFIVDDHGSPWFLDANPRFGGGYPFTHEAGVNYLRYIVAVQNGLVPPKLPVPRPVLGTKGLQLFARELVK